MRRTQYPLFLTVTETATILNIPERTVREKIRRNKLPISPHGKPYRVNRDALFWQLRKEGENERGCLS